MTIKSVIRNDNKENEIDVSEIVRRYKEDCRKYDLDPKDEQNYICLLYTSRCV